MRKENQLAGQRSPYLLQHLHNPVEWYPWGEEAFARARETDRPIFLSIGYSTCHWCHVMERESFEDEGVARVLNGSFVSIKVDREERPDVDRVYMAACQMLTGSGGWPLTIIMTPSGRPFFAGTYIPRESAGGRAGLVELLEGAAAVWNKRRDEVEDSAAAISEALGRGRVAGAGGGVADAPERAFREFSESYDPTHGGFGGAPKFPSAQNLLFLLRYWHATGEERARFMALETLRMMRRGGIFDHLGFGFHRYSTDGGWLLPHFEKMLYDQAMISMALCEAYQAGGDEFHSRAAREVFEYVLRDMTSPGGGFYSAEDADSEGREGRFYLWTADEIVRALGGDDARYLEGILGIQKEGNFLDEATGRRTGENVLHAAADPGDPARFESLRERLFMARLARPRPFRDEKILADWNGLMIAALALGARVLDDDRCLEAARRCADFVWREFVRDGHLMHAYMDGTAAVPGYLDDYAFMIWGLLDLYGAGFDPLHLERALRLAGWMRALFAGEGGALRFVPSDGEAHIADIVEHHDGAYPSGNGVACSVLLRLARLTGEPEWEERAEEILRGAAPSIREHPRAHATLLTALLHARGEPCEVVVAGDPEDPVFREMIAGLRRRYLPHCAVLVKPLKGSVPPLEALAPFTEGMTPAGGKPSAYVCRDRRCNSPVHTAGGMLDLL